MAANIRVTLQVGRDPGHQDREVVLPLSESLLYEALEPVDLPDPKAPLYAQMMCTSALKIGYVMVERERMAKMLAETLTRALLDEMKAEDTLMGYKVSNVELRGDQQRAQTDE